MASVAELFADKYNIVGEKVVDPDKEPGLFGFTSAAPVRADAAPAAPAPTPPEDDPIIQELIKRKVINADDVSGGDSDYPFFPPPIPSGPKEYVPNKFDKTLFAVTNWSDQWMRGQLKDAFDFAESITEDSPKELYDKAADNISRILEQIQKAPGAYFSQEFRNITPENIAEMVATGAGAAAMKAGSMFPAALAVMFLASPVLKKMTEDDLRAIGVEKPNLSIWDALNPFGTSFDAQFDIARDEYYASIAHGEMLEPSAYRGDPPSLMTEESRFRGPPATDAVPVNQRSQAYQDAISTLAKHAASNSVTQADIVAVETAARDEYMTPNAISFDINNTLEKSGAEVDYAALTKGAASSIDRVRDALGDLRATLESQGVLGRGPEEDAKTVAKKAGITVEKLEELTTKQPGTYVEPSYDKTDPFITEIMRGEEKGYPISLGSNLSGRSGVREDFGKHRVPYGSPEEVIQEPITIKPDAHIGLLNKQITDFITPLRFTLELGSPLKTPGYNFYTDIPSNLSNAGVVGYGGGGGYEMTDTPEAEPRSGFAPGPEGYGSEDNYGYADSDDDGGLGTPGASAEGAGTPF